MLEGIKGLFVNPHGVLCYEVAFFGEVLYTKIDVHPSYGYWDVEKTRVNLSDFYWEN